MGVFGGGGAKDPRDQVGRNPTGRERRSSAGRRGKAARRLERDLKDTEWSEEQ